MTLKVVDVGGNKAEETHIVTVRAAGETGEGSSGGANGGSGAGGANGSSGGGNGQVASPLARAAVVSHSLSDALSKGLAVLYSVNEQVAGRVEVLLSRKVAHELGISGTPAVGLPAGSEPMLVIAKALVVTTKAGQSTLHVKFSKRTAERLRRRKKITFELRMVVRNAATQNPATSVTTTVVTLGPAHTVHPTHKAH